MDLTVANFSWFAPDLRIHKSAISLSGMDKQSIDQIYAARDKIAATFRLFKTTLPGDRGHLQNFEDDSLDSVSSLMALMHAVGPKKMNWKPQFRKPTNYLCDLGLGGDLYFVGTAIDIWEQNPTSHISPSDLARALGAKKKADPRFSADKYLGRSGPPMPEQPKESDIRPSDIKAVQAMLRAELDSAAANWKLWKPVNYPSAERRPPNPVKR